MFDFIIISLCRDSAMIFLNLFFVKVCGERGWCHMPFCTLLLNIMAMQVINCAILYTFVDCNDI